MKTRSAYNTQWCRMWLMMVWQSDLAKNREVLMARIFCCSNRCSNRCSKRASNKKINYLSLVDESRHLIKWFIISLKQISNNQVFTLLQAANRVPESSDKMDWWIVFMFQSQNQPCWKGFRPKQEYFIRVKQLAYLTLFVINNWRIRGLLSSSLSSNK